MTMHRILTLSLGLATLITASAQVNMNSIMQKAQGNQGGGASVSFEEDKSDFVPNKFIGSFQMEVHSYKNGVEEKDSPARLNFYSNADMTLFHPVGDGKSKEEMKVLIDLKGKWQYTLMTDKKGKRTAMKMRKMKTTVSDGSSSDKTKEPTYERTGETRTINGHLCHKWVGTNEDGTWTSWIAEDLQAPFMDMARSVGVSMEQPQTRMPKGMNGFIMEGEFIDAKGKERTEMFTRELSIGKVDESVFSLDGYEVMEMPTMNFGGQ